MGKKGKMPDMNLPIWFDGQNINEALFCEEFLRERRIIFANGAFFTPDGRVTDDLPLRGEIYDKLKFCAVNNIPRKITNILEVLKLEAQVPDFPPEQDRIHLSNGTLLLDGTFTEGRPAIVRSRLPVAYNPDAILSAVMHADERNRAMSEALGEEVYHYHLHVVYIPVVEKQILWSKRCKDEALRGTVKEIITQVSRSKKWESKPVLDEDGNPMLNAKGKKILRSSYSVLQDDFFHFMRVAGYTDLERGERGSTEEHLTVTQFKVQAEQQRLEAVTGQVAQAEQNLEDAKAATAKQKKKLESLQKETKAAKTIALTVQDIEAMGKKATFGNNITLTPDECDTLKRYAVNGIIANADNKRLKEKLASAEKTVSIWKQRYEAVNEKYMELKQKAQPFLDALEIASERVRAFISAVLARGKETQEHQHPARKRGQDMEI